MELRLSDIHTGGFIQIDGNTWREVCTVGSIRWVWVYKYDEEKQSAQREPISIDRITHYLSPFEASSYLSHSIRSHEPIHIIPNESKLS